MADTEWIERPITVSLKVERCYECGSVWACETRGGGRPRCPCCAGRIIDAARAERDEFERKLNAQKAATTRAAKGRKRRA